jgi:hypothetical protein
VPLSDGNNKSVFGKHQQVFWQLLETTHMGLLPLPCKEQKEF